LDSHFFCPKLRPVRTLSPGFSPLLSEVTPGSDSLSRFSHSPVRSYTKFGLSLSVFTLSCPKLHQVRTLSPGFPALLSEVAPGSDSISRFFASPVRSYTKFGLSLSVFRLSCPKLHQVRTLSPGFPALLSEVTPSSDSLSRFSHSPVRSCVWFRLIPFNVSHFSAHQQAGAVHLTAE